MTSRRRPREIVKYREKYINGAARLVADCLPVLHHTSWTVLRAELLEAGIVEIEGAEQEFQVIKMYLAEPK